MGPRKQQLNSQKIENSQLYRGENPSNCSKKYNLNKTCLLLINPPYTEIFVLNHLCTTHPDCKIQN